MSDRSFPPTALFRCDASPGVGAGHVMRCLTLAAELTGRGWRCAFTVVEGAERVVPALSGGPHGLYRLAPGAWNDAAALAALVPMGVDLLVADHYGLDASYEKVLRPWARRILAIDDLADRPHHCDWLLDQSVGRAEADYAPLVPPDCHMLVGGAYAQVRRDFLSRRPDALARRAAGRVERLLISLGGTDPTNVTGLVLDALAEPLPGVAVVAVMGAAAPYLDDVRAKAARMNPPAEVLVGVAGMAELMAQCDLAVGAGGTTAWERCCLGLPTLVIITAGNQRLVARGLAEAGAALVAGEAVDLSPAGVAEQLRRMIGQPAALAVMAERAAALCDGTGVSRVADILEAGTLLVRPADMDDAGDLLAWRNDPQTRANSRNPDEVPLAGHLAWLQRRLGDSGCLLLIGEQAGEKQGMVRFDRGEDGVWEVSIALAPGARGAGMGTRLLSAGLAAFRAKHGGPPVTAAVLAGNVASEKLFLRCGFVLDGIREGTSWFRFTR